jgi:hypothetical protein
MLDDRPALVPAAMVAAPRARERRSFGAFGWVAATALCALSVYAVRDTMFAPLAKSDAPTSAWETKAQPGASTPSLAAASNIRVEGQDDDADTDTEAGSPTGTTIAGGSSGEHVGGTSAASGDTASSASGTPAALAAGSSNADVTTTIADASTSSTPSTSTPDTLGGHGANAGGGKGGSGSGSGSP